MKHQFKPFDQVLVRLDHRLHPYMGDKPDTWSAATFSHTQNARDERIVYNANSLLWDECIPYNKNTAHLLGTNKPYKEPEPKVWHVVNIKNGEPYEFTHNEFEHFIKTAALNNKDITDFNARYVNN